LGDLRAANEEQEQKIEEQIIEIGDDHRKIGQLEGKCEDLAN